MLLFVQAAYLLDVSMCVVFCITGRRGSPKRLSNRRLSYSGQKKGWFVAEANVECFKCIIITL